VPELVRPPDDIGIEELSKTTPSVDFRNDNSIDVYSHRTGF
jgi:hypothetical protein